MLVFALHNLSVEALSTVYVSHISRTRDLSKRKDKKLAPMQRMIVVSAPAARHLKM